MKQGCPFGTHRVIEPKGVLPQPAWKIDNNMELYDNEILIDVERLNIDSASFTEIKQRANK
ncbi:MAG: L-erythro-3,5-diaminohexanoate dehydrogenase, partial [bacterium]|nr:L-erythro-3,5-diaminohexanoate dehydrogenase [bacterium]